MEDDHDHMHDQDGSHDAVDEPQNNASKKKKNFKPRGRSKGLKHKAGVVREIKWDGLNRPIGKWKKAFVNYIGSIARDKVSILIDEWHNVPQGLKDTLWLDVKREFRVEDKDVYKAKVLQKCCKAWTRHKSNLVSGWIECSRKMPADKREPYEMYEFSEEVWDEFVKIHSTEEAKEKRKKARYSQSHNVHPHRMGQKTYVQKIPEWQEMGLMPSPSTSSMSTSDTSSVVSAVSDRTIAWLLARSKLNEEGNIYVPNEETQMVKNKIDEWRKKEATGEFVPGRLDDALNRALEKRDRHGRVLGVGTGVTIKEAFGLAGCKGIREADMAEIERRVSQTMREEMKEELSRKVREEVREEVKEEVRAEMNILFEDKFITLARQLGIQLPNQNMRVETSNPIAQQIPSSCQSGGVNSLASQEVNDKEPRSCQLALVMNDQRVIVADGTWYPKMTVDHHKVIPTDNVRVSVDRFPKKYENVPVPVPSLMIKKLYQAHGSFVQWPKVLVDLSTDEERIPKANTVKRKEVVSGANTKTVASGNGTKGSFTKQKKVFLYDKNFQHLSQQCKIMHTALSVFAEYQIIHMPFDKKTFLYDRDNIEITREDVIELLTGDRLNVPMFQVFIMAVCADNVDNLSFQNSFGFMCPNMISETMVTTSMDESMTYMLTAMQEQSSKRFIFCPYYEENHWILLVLCTSASKVYVFDSLRPPPQKKRRLIVRFSLGNAFRNYRVLAGRQSTGNSLTWIDADCAQQDGATECGYFVMRYILEIVRSHHNSENLTKVLKRSTPYSEDEINDARDIWAAYFLANAPM